MARPALRIDVTSKDQKELRELAERRSATGPSRSARLGAVATGQGRKRAADCWHDPAHPAGHSQGWPSLSGRRPGTGTVREAAAGSGRGAGRQPETAHHCHGLQRPARRPRSLDGAPGGRRSRKTADWCHAWEEKPSAFSCSATTSSRGGKKMWCVADLDDDYIAKMEDVLETYERPTIRKSRWSAWTRSRSRCTPMFVPHLRPNRGGKPDAITNTNAAALPMFSAR